MNDNKNGKEKVTTEKGLAEAIKKGAIIIEVSGPLAAGVKRIILTGRIAWTVAFVSLTATFGLGVIAVVLLPPTGGTSGPAGLVPGAGVGSAAVATLGLWPAISAMGIAVAAGGVGILNRLRSYKIIESSPNKVVLRARAI